MDQEERLRSVLADRYRIEREIGSGGMATVYLAQDLKHDRQVAVKVLKPDLAQNLGAERFLREIRTVANLTHPHILPIHDSGEADGFLYYVMPYAKGESLRSRLTKEKQLPVEDAIQITREIADALAYAHREGVIHRDVKPANIMLAEGHAVLADFGVAHAVAEAKDDRITRTGTSLGTPAYMSPEQATGEQDLDGRSDQYALGCVLYEMLAGHPPFTGAQVEALIRQHLTEEPPSVTRARPLVTGDVVTVINRALSKSPADRFRTTGEMAAALALTASPSRKEPKPFSNPLRTALGMVVLVVIAVVGTLFLRPDGGPPPGSPGVGQGERPSIAVLPFDNFSPDPNDAYFADGMQEQLVLTLSKISGLSVKGRTSSMRYRDDPKTLPEIADELGVAFVIEGSARMAGGQVSVTVQLIDAVRDEHLWADEYDREFSPEELFSVHREIAEHVVSEVQAVLTPEDEARLTSNPTANTPAFDEYLKGRFHWAKRTPVALETAIGHFNQAIALDSSFAEAYAGLADCYGTLPYYSGIIEARELLSLGERAAQSAVRLAPDMAEAQASLGILRLLNQRDWAGAERGLRKAIALDPSYPTAHHFLASLLGYSGRFEEAILEERKALDLDPFSYVSNYFLSELFYWSRDYEAAIRQYESVIKLFPDVFMGWQSLAEVLFVTDSIDYGANSLSTGHDLYGLDPTLSETLVGMAVEFHRNGTPSLLPSAFDTVSGLPPAVRAREAMFIGDTSKALFWLERAALVKDPTLFVVAHRPLYDPLRDHPRFQALLERFRDDVEH